MTAGLVIGLVLVWAFALISVVTARILSPLQFSNVLRSL